MEGNLSSGSMGSGASYGSLNLQASMRVNHHQYQHQQRQPPLSLNHQHNHPHIRPASVAAHPSIPEVFPLPIQDHDQIKGDRSKNSGSDEDEPSFTEDNHSDPNRAKKMSTWQRVKWTDTTVRILITAVSYIGEDAVSEHGSGVRKRYSNLQKKGKWKSVSKVMAERGHFVSPQQCEDKFNDLNKRYKRLNEILGRGTSCEVVENPSLLDMMDHIPEKSKEEVRKILNSKHLYYEEMCSYHNGNRLHLPPDPELQRSLRLALRSGGDDQGHNDFDEDDREAEMDERDEFEENQTNPAVGSGKRIKQYQGYEDIGFGNSLNSINCNRTLIPPPQQQQIVHADMNQVLPEGTKSGLLREQWMKQRALQLEEQKLQIEAQMLELEKERFKWERFSAKKDQELDMMRMDNQRMKLENERMALELKQREMDADGN